MPKIWGWARVVPTGALLGMNNTDTQCCYPGRLMWGACVCPSKMVWYQLHLPSLELGRQI